MPDSTTRFSNRVQDYIKYRPHYPSELLPSLKKAFKISEKSVVADIGSGTGISSMPFLQGGLQVYGVEPNEEMRKAAEDLLADQASFISIKGEAEATNLADRSVDLVFAGQAFHWFDLPKAKKEFERILKPEGHIVLAWNQRSNQSSFQKAYEEALQNLIPEYGEVRHRNISDQSLQDFLAPRSFHKFSLPNFQHFDLEGLKGRLMSSSYCPKEGSDHEKLMLEMEKLFKQHQENGKIRFDYETWVYWG